jgi:Apea-like HEPN
VPKAIVNLDLALGMVRTFLEDLHARGSGLGWSDDGILMAARDEKVLTFTGDERDHFYRCLTALGRATYHRPISNASLRAALDDTVFAALDRPATEFDAGLATAIRTLRDRLMAPAEQWRVAYRIQWIDADELPFMYRDVLFVRPDVSILQETINPNLPHDELSKYIKEFGSELREGVGIAVVDASGCDEQSARAVALERVRSTVDEMTGLAALVSPSSIPVVADVFNYVRVSLVTIASNTTRGEAVVRSPVPLPADVVHPRRIFAVLSRNAPTSRLDSILGKAPDDELSSRIRAAARYIGRAQLCSFEERVDDSFLYFVVALESLLGRKDFRDSIGYQLRLRVAHLIGHDADERAQIEREVSRLYDVRSQLLHKGTREVRAFDLTQARAYALRCLSVMLFRASVNKFTKFGELEEWFRLRLLA